MKYFVIMGATGDLAKTKLYPALAETYSYNTIQKSVHFIGAGRKEYSQEQYRQLVNESLKDRDWKLDFVQDMDYVQLDLDQVSSVESLINHYNIEEGDELIWYMAIPPQAFEQVIQTLSQIKEQYPHINQKLVFEKPFGSDLASSQHLNTLLQKSFQETEIYRVDHYLGKETIQNILALRFGNTMFEPLLNNHYVESISIDVWETRGIDGRAEYFDKSGIIKDILQNHILQTMALMMMEGPIAMESEYIRNAKYNLLRSLRPIQHNDVILGQYTGNDTVKGYIQEEGVKPDSQTETFVALTSYVDNARWEGVPIYISTGKRLSENKAEIRIKFKQSFKYFAHIDEECNPQQNELVIQIQPNEEVYYTVNAKFPGKGMCIQPVKLHFTYDEAFGQRSQGAYTRLIDDILEGDQSLFIRSDEIEESWKYVDPLIQSNNVEKRELILYESGMNPSDIQFS